MIVALDVHYLEGRSARAAALWFDAWQDPSAAGTATRIVEGVADYHPGRFFERELPPLLAILQETPTPSVVIVDGYCALDEKGSQGLGAYLAQHLASNTRIVGVAKRRFRGSTHAVEILRGESQRPLFVTAVGVPAKEAARSVQSMHGTSRIPTLLKQVDALARKGESPD